MVPRVAALTLTAALTLARNAPAETVDGQLDTAYGTALVTQTTQTGLGNGQIAGDNNQGDLNFANGSELDEGYAFIENGVLYLFLSGNLAMELNVNQNKTVGHILDIFVDSVTGGQNMLNGLGAGVPLNGLTFDAGFEADYWLEFVGDAGGSHGPPYWTASYAEITAQGGGTLTMLGVGSAGSGTLTGGTNPYGIQATINNTNVAGVTYGCGASSGSGVATGIEWAVPLAAIGSPTGCVKINVIIREPGTTTSAVSNQVLAPVPVGTCPLGSASTVNFATIAGDQFFSVCPSAAGVPPAPPADLVLLGATPNPSRGGQVRVLFTLPDARPATLRMLDLAGRVVREATVSAPAGGSGQADLSGGTRVPVGMYWLRLTQGQASVTRSVCVLR